jgi:hypothetical protein
MESAERRSIMKKVSTAMIVLLMGILSVSCATTNGYNTQRGAVMGGVLGALAGQAIGRNTAGTLIGAAGGALAGAIVGNAAGQDEYNRRVQSRETPQTYAGPAHDAPPPGEWVTVPGGWSGGRWVPAHRAWVPINPN